MPSQSYIEYLLAVGRIEEAIECLLVVTQGTGRYEEVMQQSAAYQEYRWYERGSLHADAVLAQRRDRIHRALQILTQRVCQGDGDTPPRTRNKPWRTYLRPAIFSWIP